MLLGGGPNVDAGLGVAIDGQGNPVLGGVAAGDLSIGPTNIVGLGGLLTKLTATGGVTWIEGFGLGVQSIAVDGQGNIFICGSIHGTNLIQGQTVATQDFADAYVAKFDPAGQLLWLQQFSGDGDEYAVSVAVDPSGNCVVVGQFQGVLERTTVFEGLTVTNANGGSYYGFLVKLSPYGTKLRTKLVALRPDASAGGGFPRAVGLDHQGNCFICGDLYGSTAFDGVVLGSALAPAIGFATGGFLVKYDPNWNVLWGRDAVGSTLSTDDYTVTMFRDVKADQGGNLFVTGFFQAPRQIGTNELDGYGHWDVVVAKYSPTGDPLWAREAGGPGNDSGERLAIDGSGNCLVTGWFQGTAAFSSTNLTSQGIQDLFVSKYDPNGQLQWVEALGGVGTAYAGLAMDLDAAGNILVAGSVVTNAAINENYFLTNFEASQYILVAKMGTASSGGTAVPTSKPTLQAHWDKGQILIAWPTDATNFVLEAAGSPEATAAWQPVAVQAQVVTNRFTVRLPRDKTTAFFRLRQAP